MVQLHIIKVNSVLQVKVKSKEPQTDEMHVRMTQNSVELRHFACIISPVAHVGKHMISKGKSLEKLLTL